MAAPWAAPGGPLDTLERIPLVDHHCHGVLTGDPDDRAFDTLLTEGGPAPGQTNFDTPVGLSVRRHCAPVLDLEPHAPPGEYLARRRELGAAEVNRRFLTATGSALFGVDTGFGSGGLTSPAELAELAGLPRGDGHVVVRLEVVAEQVAAGTEPGEFGAAFADALDRAVREQAAIAVKSIAAYRCGLDLDPRRPGPGEVAAAAARWSARPGTGHDGTGHDGTGHDGTGPDGSAAPGAVSWRLYDPVLVRHLLWAAVDLGLPIQFHIGYGDADIRLDRVDPSLLTDWLHLHRVPVMLLHTWPFHRQAGYLAGVHPHVYYDVGLAMHNVGRPRGAAILAEAMEVAPFTKLLYSSDAFALAELYHLAASGFRAALNQVLGARVADGEWSQADAVRIAHLATAGNARRVYGLPEPDPQT
ncbi:MAG TPA: amidohydrolase family protein [Kineosporiaceae bacterium]|nr:amidohydrolase family protein [Kineosporiaceae bacterium]